MTNKELYQSIEARLPVFFQSWWLDAVCSGSWDVAIVSNHGSIQAVWPYQVEQKLGFTLIRNPVLTPYLGPLIFPDTSVKEGMQVWDREEQLLQQLLEQVPSRHYFQFHAIPGFRNFLPLLHQGFSNTNRITYQIDLSLPEQVLLERMQKRRRRYIKNAAAEWTIEEVTESMMPDFFALHRHTFEKKKQKYPYSQPFLEQLIAKGKAHRASRFWAVRQAGGPVSAMLWVAYDDTTMYQLLSAYAVNEHHNTAMSLLTWHAVTEARQLGLRTFDFEGSIHPGIEPFFRKFGGDRAYFMAFEQYNSALWRLKKSLLG